MTRPGNARKVADDCGAVDVASDPIETIRRKDVDAVLLAKECGVERVALELHGSQCVYNVPSLLKLRTAIGPVVGTNLDPSHLFWMGADPPEAGRTSRSASVMENSGR